MGSIILIILGLILGLFTLRVIWGAIRFMYGIAPFIVIWSIIILGILYSSGDLQNIIVDIRKQNDAANITTVKN